MSLSFDTVDEHLLIVRVGATLDFRSADHFKAACQDRISGGADTVVLDFSKTSLLDSVGLGAIFSIYRHITPKEGHLVFAGPHGAVQTLIDVTHVDHIFPIYASVEKAREALGA